MEDTHNSWLNRLRLSAKLIFWLLLIFLLIQQALGPSQLASARSRMLDRLQTQRKTRVIAMIHRQDTVSLFGVPVSSSIDIEDSEAILRAIRITPNDQPIDMILHTPGGLLLAAEQVAKALVGHKGKVTVFVPHYAMSGGTLIALAADEIVMDPNAVLGPVDPQIGDMPAASIVRLLEFKRPSSISDEMLVMADISQKARLQVAYFVGNVLLKHMPRPKAAELTMALSEGRWTHDFPITVEAARELGLPISTNMPQTIYDLMELYPQAGSGRPSVIYVPLRHTPSPQSAPTGQPAAPAPAAAKK